MTPATALGLALLLLGSAVGCAEDDPLITPTDVLQRLPECTDPPAGDVERPEGITLPVGTTLTSVDRTSELIRVEGWVPRDPLRVREEYEGMAEAVILTVEDEVIETEVLVTTGTHRTYVKVNAVCRGRSALSAVVAPESAGDSLPTPAGGG